MYSKIKLFGHPVHPMLVSFPITFYTIAFVGFVVYQINGSSFIYKAAYYSNIIGVLTALAAAVPGSLDWFLGIPDRSPAKKRGALHAVLNVSALLLFIVNAFVLGGTANSPVASVVLPIFLTGLGFLLTLAASYHGYALIGTHKVGVDLSPEQEQWEAENEIRRAA